MNDEMERLQSALRANRPRTPAEFQERAIAAALAAFDDHHRTISESAGQAKDDNHRRGAWRLFLPVSNWWRRPAFASAITLGLAAVLFVAYLRPFTQPRPQLLGQGFGADIKERRLERERRLREEQKMEAAVPFGTGYSMSAEGLGRGQELEAAAPPSLGVLTGAESAPPLGLDVASGGRAMRSRAADSAGDPAFRDQGRDRFTTFDPNPVKVTAEEPVSTFSIDVDTASYAFMRASLNRMVLPPQDAVRIEELINYFPYNYALPDSREAPFAANVSVLPAPWNPTNRLLHIGIRGYMQDPGAAKRANLVFLVDTSGSMNAPNKLPLLVNSLKLLLETLTPQDRVAVVTYAGAAGVVLPPTPVAEKSRIHAALERLGAGGSTAGAEGIRQAYLLAEEHFVADGINRVVLATDGDFNVGITDPQALTGFVSRKRNSGVYLSVLGFGMGNYNDDVMQRLAQNGNGNAAYIDSLSEARKTLAEEATALLFPIAKDVKIQVEFNPATVSEYRLIGYETRMLRREDFSNDQVDAGDIGAGHIVTAIYELTPAGSGAERTEPLRYQAAAPAGSAFKDELAFLKIRYKLPEEETSKLITRPVTSADAAASVEAAPREVRFAAAVAAFGQLLRGGRYIGDYDYDDVAALAQDARGQDPYGYRAEFIGLVKLAQSAATLAPLPSPDPITGPESVSR